MSLKVHYACNFFTFPPLSVVKGLVFGSKRKEKKISGAFKNSHLKVLPSVLITLRKPSEEMQNFLIKLKI